MTNSESRENPPKKAFFIILIINVDPLKIRFVNGKVSPQTLFLRGYQVKPHEKSAFDETAMGFGGKHNWV